MKKILFLVVMGSIGLSQPKEKMNINGYVLNKESGEAIPYANIMVNNSSWGTITNSDCYFALVGIPKGKIFLMVTYIRYDIKTEKLTVVQIEKGPLFIQISPRALQGEIV